jgi:hypothetical protein
MQNPTSEEGAIIKREWWNVCIKRQIRVSRTSSNSKRAV